jgi:hypothetical protein
VGACGPTRGSSEASFAEPRSLGPASRYGWWRIRRERMGKGASQVLSAVAAAQTVGSVRERSL